MDIQKISDDFKEIKKKWGKEGKDFNFFQFIEDKFWKITETKHSRILAFFLDPNEIHGQGGEFLKLFLRRLGFDVSNFNAEKWEIYVEKDNIDILLQSDTISIVIENKSNGAANQEHQLYRYWVNGIYHFHHEDIEKAENKNLSRIVYLPDGWSCCRKPIGQTQERPDYLLADEYPERLNEDIITTWTYVKDIKEWLEECAAPMDDNNIIKHFISNYITYWSKIRSKDKKYMDILEKHLTSKEEWSNINEISKQVENLKNQWIEDFDKKIKVHNDNYFWGARYSKQTPYDFRWGIQGSGWDDMCFLYYPYVNGLSIWGRNFSIVKNKYKAEFEEVFKAEFQWIDDDADYAMRLRGESFELRDDENGLVWEFHNNTKLVERIIEVIEKYTYNRKVFDLFKKVNEDIRNH